MGFDNDKKVALKKIIEFDKSKKGSVDKPIAKLVEDINSKNDFYTTSSCSGRIVLLAQSETGKKHKADCIFMSHSKISLKQVKDALEKLPKNQVWFRFEPLILHVACRNIESAEELVKLGRSIGFKRSGIQSTRKMIVEICSTEKIDTIIAEKGKLLVNDSYLNILVRETNKKFEKNKEKIKKLKI